MPRPILDIIPMRGEDTYLLQALLAGCAGCFALLRSPNTRPRLGMAETVAHSEPTDTFVYRKVKMIHLGLKRLAILSRKCTGV